MIKSQIKIHEILTSILGSKNAYFQPPSSVRMKYPAIRYSLKKIDKRYANNLPYCKRDCYEVIYIDTNPDSDVLDKISNLPMCEYDRHYVSDNLNHYVFTLFI